MVNPETTNITVIDFPQMVSTKHPNAEELFVSAREVPAQVLPRGGSTTARTRTRTASRTRSSSTSPRGCRTRRGRGGGKVPGRLPPRQRIHRRRGARPRRVQRRESGRARRRGGRRPARAPRRRTTTRTRTTATRQLPIRRMMISRVNEAATSAVDSGDVERGEEAGGGGARRTLVDDGDDGEMTAEAEAAAAAAVARSTAPRRTRIPTIDEESTAEHARVEGDVSSGSGEDSSEYDEGEGRRSKKWTRGAAARVDDVHATPSTGRGRRVRGTVFDVLDSVSGGCRERPGVGARARLKQQKARGPPRRGEPGRPARGITPRTGGKARGEGTPVQVRRVRRTGDALELR